MRSFSLRGIASKGFYGPNAKTLGAPTGGGQGNSSGFPTPAFAAVDGGIFGVDFVASMAQRDATHLAVVTDAGNAAVSTNGGTTWTFVPGPLGLITQALIVLTNTAGTVLVAFGTAGAARVLSRSTNGGTTWTDVTPAGSTPAPAIFYSATANLFFFFENTIAQSWTSPDGLTWTSHVLPAIFIPVPEVSGVPGMAENGTDIVVQVDDGTNNDLLIAHSLDAITWTKIVLHAAQISSQAGSTYWTGTKFVTQATPDSVATVWTSNAAGTVWTLKSSSANPNVPPYSQQDPFFNGNYYNGFNQNDFVSFAISPDAVTWTLVDMTAFAYLNPQAFYPAGTHLYLFGSGILQSTGPTTFAVALTLSFPGFVNNLLQGPAGIFAVGSNNAGHGAIWRLV